MKPSYEQPETDDQDLIPTLPNRPSAPLFSIVPDREAVAIIQASLIEVSPSGPATNAGGLLRPGGRLPGRALRSLSGQPVIFHLVERVRKARAISRVVVALSVAPEDDALIAPARRAGAQIFRGSVHDLVGRLCGCVDWLGLSDCCPLVRVLADTPMVDPDYLDAGITTLSRLSAGALEFEEDRAEELCPGLGAAFLSTRALRLLDSRARSPVHRADAMAYVYEHQDEIDLQRVPLPPSLHELRGGHRLLLQTAEDLALHEAIYLRLYHGAPIDTRTALAFLDADPVLASLNRGVLHRGMTLPPKSDAGWRAR
jgi:spore coat polysaccharide biosynthesis protein SpsF